MLVPSRSLENFFDIFPVSWVEETAVSSGVGRGGYVASVPLMPYTRIRNRLGDSSVPCGNRLKDA